MSELIEKSTQLSGNDEGFRQFFYLDSRGIPTVAYGRNLRSTGIRKYEASYLLSNDINEGINDFSNTIPWYTKLSINRQVVLIDMYINNGLHGLLEFKEFLNFLYVGKYKQAANEIRNSLAYKKLTSRYERLARITESDIYECK